MGNDRIMMMIVSNIIGHGHVCRTLKNHYCEIFKKGVNDSTCRKRADASHGKNSSFKSQVIDCFNVFATIITSKIMAYLMSILLSN